ncbi:hypothetical protein JCM18750_25230 [Halostagnicola bangensis]
MQISILLFGIIVASLSLFRQEIETGLVDVQNPLIWGGLLIATGVILATFVFIHTTVSPQPYASILAERQNRLNEKLPDISDEDDQHFIAEFSELYHNVVNRIGVGNRILGGVVGASVGFSLGGVFLSSLSVISQIGMERTITSWAIVGITIVVIILTVYGFIFAYNGVSDFKREWMLEK